MSDSKGSIVSLALTGGIATGKSTALECLKRLGQSRLVAFDCDASVAALLESREVIEEVAGLLGRGVLGEDGGLNRGRIREVVFGDSAQKRALEEILHPKVREECLEKLSKARSNPGSNLFVADIPLLYENGFDFGQDLNVVVATTSKTQKQRFRARNRFDEQITDSILSAQLPIGEKVARGDVILWNEGPPRCLEDQISCLMTNLL